MKEPELSPDQVKAAELLAGGMGKAKVAAEVGIARNTLHTWQQLPKFAVAYQQACARAHRETIAMVQRTQKKATHTLVKALSNPDANVAVRAALGLLANGWKAGEHFNIDERLKTVEERQNASQLGPAIEETGATESVGADAAESGPEDPLSLTAG